MPGVGGASSGAGADAARRGSEGNPSPLPIVDEKSSVCAGGGGARAAPVAGVNSCSRRAEGGATPGVKSMWVSQSRVAGAPCWRRVGAVLAPRGRRVGAVLAPCWRRVGAALATAREGCISVLTSEAAVGGITAAMLRQSEYLPPEAVVRRRLRAFVLKHMVHNDCSGAKGRTCPCWNAAKPAQWKRKSFAALTHTHLTTAGCGDLAGHIHHHNWWPFILECQP